MLPSGTGSASSSVSVRALYSGGRGGAVALLSLRRRKMLGPILPFRLAGAAEDCCLLLANRWARLEKRRIRLLFLGEASGIALGLLLAKLLPSESFLVLRDRIVSGSGKLEGHGSSSLSCMGSGDGWTEELVVRTTVPGDIMGDPCCELEAAEDALMADTGTVEG